MAQERDDGSPCDRSRIDIGEDEEVRYRSITLGVTPERLRAVVQSVGPGIDVVRANIASASPASNREPLTTSDGNRVAVEA